MDERQQQEVWEMLERDALQAIARRGPEVVFATISGAHLYGFASPDSDVDLRGAFLLPVREMLGLRPPNETLTLEENQRFELDWVAHDLRKFARLMANHNGYVMEQLFSPLRVISTPEHEELCAIAQRCLTRPMVRHYRGFARGRRKRLREPKPTVKHLLYAYRVYLSGIHLMRHGEVVSNLEALVNRMQDVQRGAISELIAMKREGAEKMSLDAALLRSHESGLDALEDSLAKAHEKSALPGEPAREALEDFVVRVRLERV